MGTYILQPVIAGPVTAPLDDVSIVGNQIRYVGPYTPVTTAWDVSDIWIDTLNSATTNVTRIWTGTAFAPARSVAAPLLVDLFTGSDGAVWNVSNWAAGTNPSAGTGGGATLLSNRGALTTSNIGNSAASGAISRKANLATQADCNLSFSFKFDATSCSPRVFIRGDSALNGTTGYAVSFSKGTWSISKYVSSVKTDLLANVAYGFAVGVLYSCRFRVVGSAVQVRVWTATAAEPPAWGYNATDTSITAAGAVGFTNTPGVPAVAGTWYVDNVTIESS